MYRKRKSKKWKRKKLMSLIKSKSLESTLCSEENNDVLYLGHRAEPGVSGGGSGTSLNSNNRSSGSKLSIRRRRKNHSRSSNSIVE